MRPSPLRAVAATATVLALALTPLATGSTSGAAEARPGKGKATARFAATELVAGAGVVQVSGNLPGPRRTVELQVRTKGTWVRLGRDRSARDGSYAVAVPFNWYGAHRLRVTARGFTKSRKVSVATPYTPAGARSAFAFREGSVARTARFDPCRTLRYQVNATQVPEALPVIQAMMAQISAATGIETRYTGTTSYVPFTTNRLPRGRADLVIAFARDADVPAFRTSEGTVGLGGYLQAFRARDSAGRPAVVTRKAGVTLQTESWSEFFTPADASTADRPPVGRLILHEVGHALGLAHVDSSVETMYFTTWDPEPDGLVHARYNRGDLSGLRKVGLAGGCVKPVRRAGRLAAAPVAPPVADHVSLLGGVHEH